MKNWKRWFFIILFVIFAAVMIVSAAYLINYYIKSAKAGDAYSSLSSMLADARQDSPSIPRLPQEQTDPSDPTGEVTTPTAPALVTVDGVQMLPEFQELYTMNSDLVGWINIPGTDIDYPVVQTPDDPNYYLNHSFEKAYSDYGAIYVKEECDVFAPSDNLTIYGHRMNDGSMFAQLHKYKEKSFFEANRYIYFDTLQAYHTYEIMAVFLISSSKDVPFQYQNFIDAADATEFDEFVSQCGQYALYDTGVSASFGDKLITLSTCEYSNENGRLVVVAKRVV